MSRNLPPAYFEELYAENPDPWAFAQSPYEAAKYATTLAALPARPYRAGFEVGCSIGVFTQQLAERCAALLAVDVSEAALQQARRRCADQPHVQCVRMAVPEELPPGPFDLIVLAEVAYYWTLETYRTALRAIRERLEPGGNLLLVHWRAPVPDYPLSGDQVHDEARAQAEGLNLWVRQELCASEYRLDLFERR